MRIIGILSILLLAAAGAQAQTTAFVGGRVIDGTGKVIENGTVVITGNKITTVGPASTPVPAGATRIDVKGKTLLPGLINAHGHVGNTVGLRADAAAGYTRENLTRQLKTYAQYGVTTVFSLGDDQEAGFALRNEPATDRARLFVAGPVIGGDTADAARAMTIKVAEMKPDLIKIRVDDNLGTTRKMPEAGVARGDRGGARAQVAGGGAHLLARRREGDAAGRRRHDRAQRARYRRRRAVHQRA